MMYTLAAIRSAIGYHTVTIFQTLMLCQLGDHLKNMGNHGGIFSVDAIAVSDVGFGHHQNVGGRLGVDVPESVDGFVFVNLGGRNLTRDDLAE